MVRQELRARLGNDLTIHNTHNCFWHTGHSVNLANGSERLNRPWDFKDSVAFGRAAGKGRTLLEPYDKWIERSMTDHFFPEAEDPEDDEA